MPPFTYPKVRHPAWRPIAPRKLLPVYPPPEHVLKYPPLPLTNSAPRQSTFNAPFTLSTHIIPAAYLRTTAYTPLPAPPPPGLSKSERQAYFEQIRIKLDVLRNPPVTSGHSRVFWICLDRYVRKGAKGDGLTLFFAHANGFPKQIWEPVIRHVLDSPSGSVVDEIWCWEAIHHGDSGLLNKDALGSDYDWSDNARDILNFFEYFIPSSATDAELPTHLPRVSVQETERRRLHGLRNRTIFPIGHSFGGCTTALVALENPHLFASLMLIDPVIIQPFTEEDEHHQGRPNSRLSKGLSRRDTWSSKDEALQGFKKSPFFGAWDPEVLNLYVEHGLYDTRDSEGRPITRLKMSGILEGVVFAATLAQQEVYQRLPSLDDNIELRWVVPGKPGAGELGPPGSTRFRVWLRPTNSSNIRIPTAGHLIPQEAPRELAREIHNFIQRKYVNAGYERVKSNL